jgi:threonine synthase
LMAQAGAAGERQPLVSSPSGNAGKPSLDRWQPYIAEAAQRFGIPEAWIRSLRQRASTPSPVSHADISRVMAAAVRLGFIIEPAGAAGLAAILHSRSATL